MKVMKLKSWWWSWRTDVDRDGEVRDEVQDRDDEVDDEGGVGVDMIGDTGMHLKMMMEADGERIHGVDDV